MSAQVRDLEAVKTRTATLRGAEISPSAPIAFAARGLQACGAARLRRRLVHRMVRLPWGCKQHADRRPFSTSWERSSPAAWCSPRSRGCTSRGSPRCAVVAYTRLCWAAFGSGCVALVLTSRFEADPSLALPALGAILALAATAIGRYGFDFWLGKARGQGRFMRRVVLVGAGDEAREFHQFLSTNPELGYEVLRLLGQTTIPNSVCPGSGPPITRYRGVVDAVVRRDRDRQRAQHERAQRDDARPHGVRRSRASLERSARRELPPPAGRAPRTRAVPLMSSRRRCPRGSSPSSA